MSAIISSMLDSFVDPQPQNSKIIIALEFFLDFWLSTRYVQNDCLMLDITQHVINSRRNAAENQIDKLKDLFLLQSRMKDAFEFLTHEYGTVSKEILIRGFGEKEVEDLADTERLPHVVGKRDASWKKLKVLEERLALVAHFFRRNIHANQQLAYWEIGHAVIDCFVTMVKMERAEGEVLELEVGNRRKTVMLYSAGELKRPDARSLVSGVKVLSKLRRYMAVLRITLE